MLLTNLHLSINTYHSADYIELMIHVPCINSGHYLISGIWIGNSHTPNNFNALIKAWTFVDLSSRHVRMGTSRRLDISHHPCSWQIDGLLLCETSMTTTQLLVDPRRRQMTVFWWNTCGEQYVCTYTHTHWWWTALLVVECEGDWPLTRAASLHLCGVLAIYTSLCIAFLMHDSVIPLAAHEPSKVVCLLLASCQPQQNHMTVTMTRRLWDGGIVPHKHH